MKVRRYLTTTILFLAVVLFVLPAEAHAYLDPGTGSYIIQIAIATFVGAMFALRLFWGRIKTFFQGLFGKQEKVQDED